MPYKDPDKHKEYHRSYYREYMKTVGVKYRKKAELKRQLHEVQMKRDGVLDWKLRQIEKHHGSIGKEAFIRDGCACTSCSEFDFFILELHHVIPTSEGGEHIGDNIRTLCSNCHKKIHLGRLSPEDWDVHFLNMARWISKSSHCLRGHFGAIVVRDHEVCGSGRNGHARGLQHCKTCRRAEDESGFGYGKCPVIHAEVNAMLHAGGREGCLGATLYLDSCNRTPESRYNSGHILLSCDNCTRLMVNAGIEWLVIRTEEQIVRYNFPQMVEDNLIK